VKLEALRWGSGDRNCLLLHGIGSNAAGWWRLAESLVERGWAVAAPDLRGHGTSEKSDDYTFEAHIADVLALGAHWDAVLGHSMGGTIATLTIDRNPEWANALILQDPALAMPDSQEDILRWLLDDFSRPLTSDQIAGDHPRWLRRDAEIKAEALRQAGEEMVAETVKVNWPWLALDEAARIQVPTRIIGSDPETGGILPVAIGRWLAESNPLIDYLMLPGSSHSAHRDDDAYRAYLEAVIGGIERPPTLRQEQ
jgi:pimeloyl-ACP methyl ester carboxylesterase